MKWKIIPKGNTTENYIVTEELNKHGYPERIAKSYKREYDNLIAAAPEMLEALIEIRKASRRYECNQCPNDIKNEENCHGCVEYTDKIIESATGLKIEEVIKA